MKLWEWFKSRGKANGRPAPCEAATAERPAAEPKPRRTEAAIDTADAKWDRDGSRADQDYYHVPGAKTADRQDPPRLHGEKL